jgi:glycosyltransferase involved in cell wall biosynthesis
MKRIRVVHVVEALGLGGLERMVALLARGAAPRFAVEVIALAGGGRVADEMEADGTLVRRLALPNYYPGSVLRAARALVTARPDVVHTHGHFAGVAGRLAARLVGLPVIVHHLHTHDTTLARRHRRLERLLGRLSRRVICCSEAVAAHARGDLGLPERLLEVVRNGIEAAPEATRDEALRRLGQPSPPLIGCVGALAPHKGHAILLHAFAALPEAAGRGTLLLAGDGAERPRLETLAGDLGIASRTLFLGERADIRALLPALDLLVAPSIGREGLGVAVLEGMDAGLPIVAARVGGLPEIVADGRTGLLVAEGDSGAFAAAIAALLLDPGWARALGAAGRARVEAEFRAAAMVRRIESIYEVALDAHPQAA